MVVTGFMFVFPKDSTPNPCSPQPENAAESRFKLLTMELLSKCGILLFFTSTNIAHRHGRITLIHGDKSRKISEIYAEIWEEPRLGERASPRLWVHNPKTGDANPKLSGDAHVPFL